MALVAPRLALASSHSCDVVNLKAPMQRAWEKWKSAFLMPDGRVVDHLQGGATHSEGQGYGLVLAAFNDDLATFDLIRSWTDANLTKRPDGLLNWRLLPNQTSPEAANATDGDLFYAWGLALGAGRFGRPEARERAIEIAGAVSRNCLATDPRDGCRLVLMPAADGFRRGTSVIFNPSYVMPRALFELANLTKDDRLAKAAHDGMHLLDELAQRGLAPDWAQIDPLGVGPSLEHAPRSGYDAIRVPLYLVWSGHRDHAAVHQALAMYGRLAGAQTPVVTDLSGKETIEASTYAGFDAVRDLVIRADSGHLAKALKAFCPKQGYYPATLQLLSLVAAVESAPAMCLG